MHIKTLLIGGAVVVAALVPAAPAIAATSANTGAQVEVYSGALSITAPATKDFGYVALGASVTNAPLGQVQVTDGRTDGPGTWTATVSSTDFSNGTDTFDTVTYHGGTCTAVSAGTSTPSCSTTTPDFTLSTTPQAAASGTGFDTGDTGTWNPTFSFTVPGTLTTTGTYTATVTHSVA